MKYLWILLTSDNPSFFYRKPHLFAAFVEIDLAGKRQREFCISWLPDQGQYSLISSAVKGRNRSLQETLRTTPQESLPIMVWGFAAVTKTFFEEAWIRKIELEKNRFKYKVIDWFQSDCRNCTSALAELDGQRRFPVGLKAGHTAGKELWNFYKGHFVQEVVNDRIENYFKELIKFKNWKKI